MRKVPFYSQGELYSHDVCYKENGDVSIVLGKEALLKVWDKNCPILNNGDDCNSLKHEFCETPGVYF